ncbi:uncharacterized protein B0I36DRAFT_134295 [Microdochium trichocladiopsis]|uniref:Uncharacterized protein n=1 Tax=Microdochium trichocladiopsis TaxID=1682393 RepID=A0A9P8Y357_9PEZI|nr:uncharacterized protein B0I36DRAFT_134295 [Microdochium trichocladiopsis]KAH7029624.1 hypothetical protein B0I36DRAFT_134295 [Microdochium trichocladiopsis]
MAGAAMAAAIQIRHGRSSIAPGRPLVIHHHHRLTRRDLRRPRRPPPPGATLRLAETGVQPENRPEPTPRPPSWQSRTSKLGLGLQPTLSTPLSMRAGLTGYRRSTQLGATAWRHRPTEESTTPPHPPHHTTTTTLSRKPLLAVPGRPLPPNFLSPVARCLPQLPSSSSLALLSPVVRHLPASTLAIVLPGTLDSHARHASRPQASPHGLAACRPPSVSSLQPRAHGLSSLPLSRPLEPFLSFPSVSSRSSECLIDSRWPVQSIPSLRRSAIPRLC